MSTPITVQPAAADEDSLEKEVKNKVYYEVETSTGRKAIVVYRVHEVYVHIPPELSAAGFELKIGGTVVVTDQVSFFVLVGFIKKLLVPRLLGVIIILYSRKPC